MWIREETRKSKRPKDALGIIKDEVGNHIVAVKRPPPMFDRVSIRVLGSYKIRVVRLLWIMVSCTLFMVMESKLVSVAFVK